MKNKKKNMALEIPVKWSRRYSNVDVCESYDGGFFVSNSGVGKKIKNPDGYICKIKDSRIRHVGVSPTGTIFSTIDMTPQELLKFAKYCIKREEYFIKFAKGRKEDRYSFFCHLNPELSFFFKGTVSKKNKKPKPRKSGG